MKGKKKMRLTNVAVNAAPQPRTYKRAERTPVLSVLPTCDEPFTEWLKTVCEKLGSSHLVIVGVNENSQPVLAPVFALERVTVTEGGKEKFSSVYGTRKKVTIDPRELEGARTFHLLNDSPVNLAAVEAFNGIPVNNGEIANTFDAVILADEDGQVETITLAKQGQTFRSVDSIIKADDDSLWNLSVSVFPYKDGKVRIGGTLEQASTRKSVVALEDLAEDLPEL